MNAVKRAEITRAAIAQERARIVREVAAVDPIEWALAGSDSARIVIDIVRGRQS